MCVYIFSTLATIFLYDFALPNGKPSSPHAKNFVDRVIPLLAPIQNLDSSPSTEGLNHGTAALNDKVSAEKEAAIRLCKTGEITLFAYLLLTIWQPFEKLLL